MISLDCCRTDAGSNFREEYSGRVSPVSPISASGDSLSKQRDRRDNNARYLPFSSGVYDLRGRVGVYSLGSELDVAA